MNISLDILIKYILIEKKSVLIYFNTGLLQVTLLFARKESSDLIGRLNKLNAGRTIIHEPVSGSNGSKAEPCTCVSYGYQNRLSARFVAVYKFIRRTKTIVTSATARFFQDGPVSWGRILSSLSIWESLTRLP